MPRVEAGSTKKQIQRPYGLFARPADDSPPEWKVYAQARARAGDECPVCLGLKVTRYDVDISHQEFGKVHDCPACSKGKMSEYLRQNSGLESWLRHARRDDWMPHDGREPQYEAAMELIAQGKGWLTLWGGYGVGKTFLLACAINGFICDRKQGVYVTGGKLLDHLRDSYGKDGPGYSYAFGQWSSCFALAVDEVNEYHATDWAQDKYRQLLNQRYDMASESVTIFACNVQPGGDDWPSDLGWLYSRMTEFPIVEAGGGDVRPLLKEEF